MIASFTYLKCLILTKIFEEQIWKFKFLNLRGSFKLFSMLINIIPQMRSIELHLYWTLMIPLAWQ